MEENENSLDQIAGAIQTIATGIPAPVTKNFWKMFGQLCTASIGVPVAHLEGMANVVKSRYEARAELVKKAGESIHDNIDVPEAYGKAAAEKYAKKILGLQANTDKIVQIAAEDLANNPAPEIEPEEISDEWLNEFEQFAKLKTSEDMQRIFGKILANEVRTPGSFSVKTIRTVSQLDHEVAQYFREACSLILTVKEQEKNILAFLPIIDFPMENPSMVDEGQLSEYKQGILREYGLLNTSSTLVKIKPLLLHYSLFYGNKILFFVEDQTQRPHETIRGCTLTQSGLELLSAIMPSLPPEINSDYIEYLGHYFGRHGYKLIPNYTR